MEERCEMTLMDAAKAEADWQMLMLCKVALPHHLPPVGFLRRHQVMRVCVCVCVCERDSDICQVPSVWEGLAKWILVMAESLIFGTFLFFI